MNKISMYIVLTLLCTSAFADDAVTKLNDTTARVTLQAPTQDVTLDQLNNQAIQIIGQIQKLQLDLTRVKSLIEAAKKAGVKTQAEVLAADAQVTPPAIDSGNNT